MSFMTRSEWLFVIALGVSYFCMMVWYAHEACVWRPSKKDCESALRLGIVAILVYVLVGSTAICRGWVRSLFR